MRCRTKNSTMRDKLDSEDHQLRANTLFMMGEISKINRSLKQMNVRGIPIVSGSVIRVNVSVHIMRCFYFVKGTISHGTVHTLGSEGSDLPLGKSTSKWPIMCWWCSAITFLKAVHEFIFHVINLS